MTRCVVLLMLLLSFSINAQNAGDETAKPYVFDNHVHLRQGEASLREYEADVASAGIKLDGLGAMWFGGSNQAPAGHPQTQR